MGWGSASRRKATVVEDIVPLEVERRGIVPYNVDWAKLVSLDFETYYSDDYTLSKSTTSEYIRDPRFKAQMVGIKIGRAKTVWHPAKDVKKAVKAIDWKTHALLAHHAHFDGMILSHHYDVHPHFIYDTLSMARALHSNEISGRLDDVSIFYGGKGKMHGRLEETKNVLVWSDKLNKATGAYCVRDVDEMYRIFKAMIGRFPAEEIEIIDLIVKMYTEPVLQLDRKLATKVLEHEIAEKKRVMAKFAQRAEEEGIKLTADDKRKLGDKATEEDIAIKKARKLINSGKFADLLREQGVEPPVKISPTWKKLPKDEKERRIDDKWIFAFSKTDVEFVELEASPNSVLRELVEARLSARSNTNETRAARFLKLNEGGAPLPVYIKYSAAHTHRLGGGDKTNFQNLKRGGDLRKALRAPRHHKVVVRDSGQIEARINGWLWGQDDLVENFRIADAFEESIKHLPKAQRPLATGVNRDAYCKFGDHIYGREITKKDDEERFVAKTCILGLGYQMSAPRLQTTLALGNGGPKVFLSEDECKRIVNTYRRANHRIKAGWGICQKIIEQMAIGIQGSYKCIAWSKDTLHLPNGMDLHYPNLRNLTLAKIVAKKLAPSSFGPDEDFDPSWPEFVYDSKESEVHIYGGKLCENIVQALARIVVIWQMLDIHKAGHKVAMTTHDEVACIVKNAIAHKVYDFMGDVMKTPPWWAQDLPLNSEGVVDDFYAK